MTTRKHPKIDNPNRNIKLYLDQQEKINKLHLDRNFKSNKEYNINFKKNKIINENETNANNILNDIKNYLVKNKDEKENVKLLKYIYNVQPSVNSDFIENIEGRGFNNSLLDINGEGFFDFIKNVGKNILNSVIKPVLNVGKKIVGNVIKNPEKIAETIQKGTEIYKDVDNIITEVKKPGRKKNIKQVLNDGIDAVSKTKEAYDNLTENK